MSDERTAELVEKLVRGTLTEEESQELTALAGRDVDALAARHLFLDRVLGAVAQPPSRAAADRLMSALATAGPTKPAEAAPVAILRPRKRALVIGAAFLAAAAAAVLVVRARRTDDTPIVAGGEPRT